MELVTLARAVLNRIGSASGGGFRSHREIRILRELSDVSVRGLMDLVKQIAVENGEILEALRTMQHSTGWNREEGGPTHVFNVQGPSAFYSIPYAECWAFPALKVGERYFRLDEVKEDTKPD